jgi:hypothetical protein
MAPQQKNDIEKCGVVEGHPLDSSKDERTGSTKGFLSDEKSHGWFIDSFKPQLIGADGEVELHKDLSSRHIQVRHLQEAKLKICQFYNVMKIRQYKMIINLRIIKYNQF